MPFEERYVEITSRTAARPKAQAAHRPGRNVAAVILFALLLVGVVASSLLAVFP